jgi:hypothetical protein
MCSPLLGLSSSPPLLGRCDIHRLRGCRFGTGTERPGNWHLRLVSSLECSRSGTALMHERDEPAAEEDPRRESES